ncbi:Transcriptional regulator, LysR family [Klebsiella pneumoniae IS46]|nr:Transcriptional regulator, LysR family [Klebsiella pneumoniae IS46]
MSDPDFNLLVALDVLLSEASVAGAARRLNLSTSAMSRTLSRLRDVTGDPILVRAGRNMVLTPWAEATRDRARRAVHDARAVLQPSTETFSAQNLARLFYHQGKRWFCGGVWACAYSSGCRRRAGRLYTLRA